MGSKKNQKPFAFATAIGGPMTFTFASVLCIEQKKYIELIQSNGGRIVDYDSRDEYTIVLTKKGKPTHGHIRFSLKYVRDCITRQELLPLENYRLEKTVKVACCYSKPLGSTTCVFHELIQGEGCCKHKIKKVNAANDEAALKNQLKLIKSQIYVDKKPQVKLEPPEVPEEEQPFETDTYYEWSQSLLRRKAK